MAVRAKSQKVQKVLQVETKSLSPMRSSTSTYVLSSKLAEVHSSKNKDVELNKIVRNGVFSKDFNDYKPLNPAMESMTLQWSNISRRGSEPNPSVSKAPKKAQKKYNIGDVHGAADIFFVAGQSANQTLPCTQSKPAPKTTPLTQLLNKNQAKAGESSRMLVTVNVSGSTGPLRFLVDAKDHVSRVIELALRAYDREGRLPHLGSNCKNVALYLNNATFEALDPEKSVGNLGTRQFLLHKKREEEFDK